jgi:hypothetical protein
MWRLPRSTPARYNLGVRLCTPSLLAGFVCAASLVTAAEQVHPQRPRLEDAHSKLIDPLAPGEDVRVFVFVRRDCPIANRYAPELVRLEESFGVVSPTATSWNWTRTRSFWSSTFISGTTAARS